MADDIGLFAAATFSQKSHLKFTSFIGSSSIAARLGNSVGKGGKGDEACCESCSALAIYRRIANKSMRQSYPT